MDAATTEALEKSIRHWEENTAAQSPEQASVDAENCALCDMFFFNDGLCRNCPVRLETGNTHCDGTPYGDAAYALTQWQASANDDDGEAFHEAARAELNFLIGLRETALADAANGET